MFKKSLAALAVLGAFAGAACAANVSVYGIVDEGVLYTHTDNGTDTTHSFALESGVNSASRLGIQGSEDLGNGMTVGFKLENGFNADDGKLANDGRLFGRQASLYLNGDFGTVAFGRMGGLASSCGTYDIFWGNADAFGGMWKAVTGLAISTRYDNMVTYQTPKFSGVQATVQYSFKEDNVKSVYKDNREGSSAVNRYAAAGLTGDFGALKTAVAYEFQNYQSFGDGARANDGHTVYLGGNYDCGFAKTFVLAQYFKDLAATELVTAAGSEGVTGYGLGLGVTVPISAGKLIVAAYYTDGSDKDAVSADKDFTTYAFGGKYEYFLSKRTSVYAGAGFNQVQKDGKHDVDTYKVGAGLKHSF